MLILVRGDVGSGKTLFATGYALDDSRALYANYRIRRKGWHNLKPEVLITLNEEPSLIIMDEGYTWLESRTSSSHLNRYLSYILFQSRKRQMDIIITAQLSRSIDVRFRLMANYDIYCEAMDIGFYYEITKLSARKIYEPIRTMLPFSEAEKIYPKYETFEKIPINKDLIEDITTDKAEVIGEVDIVVNELLKIAPAKKWTKGAVANYCLRNDIPRHRVELIINAIKGQALMDMSNNIKVEE
jgi:hypothetical protein